MSKTIVGIFNDSSSAEEATNKMNQTGINTNNISIITKENKNQTNIKQQPNASMTNNNPKAVNDNISDGTVTGTILGGVAGLLIGIGTVIIPGLGVIAAAGPVVGLLSGAVTGGIVGGLVDLGIPEDRSKEYEHHIKSGDTFLSVKCDDNNVEKVSTILRTTGAKKVEVH